MELHEPVDPLTIGTIPVEPMANPVRVGYTCGEHDVDNHGLHHTLFRGKFLDAEQWDDGFPDDGYFPTAAERAMAELVAGE